MKRLAVAVLLLVLIGVVALTGGKQPDVPSMDVFQGMDLTDALIVGVVRGPDGDPAAEAAVFVDGYFRTIGTHESHAHRPQSTRTDDEGRFVFRASDALREEARRTRVKVWAERDGLVAPQTLLRLGSRPEIARILTLGPSLQPRVRLVDPKGEPVANAYVKLDFDVPPLDSFEVLYTLGARSGPDGVAVLPRLPDRGDWRVRLRVNAKDMAPFDTDLSARSLRRTEPEVVHLPAGCTLRGRVELPDGMPAVGARVSACAHPTPRGGQATETDDRGSFVLRGVPAEHVMVTIEALPPVDRPPRHYRGIGAYAVTPDARLTREIDGTEGAVVDLGTLRLSKTHSISGVVLDMAGNPAALGHVMAGEEGVGHSIYAGGRFEVTGLDRGRHSLTATIYESGSSRTGGLKAKIENVPVGATDVVFRVTGGGNLIVRFHPAGKPDELLEVWKPMLRSPTQGGGGPGGKYTEIRRTINPGRYSDFSVEAEGYKEKRLGPVEIHADRPTIVHIEMEPAKPNSR